MKRSIILSVIAGLVFSACGGGKDYVAPPVCKKGQKSTAEKPCTPLGAVNPTASPTPTTARTKAATATKPPVVRTTKPPACNYKGTDHTIVIRDVFNKYQPESRRVYRGDFIIFKNEDPENPHSLTVDGTDFDTGILKPGTSKKLRVMLAPQVYKRWHDRQVSYIDGGPLEVLHNPRCAG